jgi:hypothetical protein
MYVACPSCGDEHAKGTCANAPNVIGKGRQQASDGWYFDDALDILGITGTEDRARCTDQLKVICNSYWLNRFVEKEQETDARKAAAFQRAHRWSKRHERAVRLFETAEKLEKSGKKNDAKPLYEKAISLSRSAPTLPQSLEQEAWRLQAKGLSRDQSFTKLSSLHKQHSRLGQKPSEALRLAFCDLQTFAADNGLIWIETSRAPRKLINFIAAVLMAAGIKDCDLELLENRSRFLKFLVKNVKELPKKPSAADLLRSWQANARLPEYVFYCQYCNRQTKHQIFLIKHIKEASKPPSASGLLRPRQVNTRVPKRIVYCQYCSQQTRHEVFDEGEWRVSWNCAEHCSWKLAGIWVLRRGQSAKVFL